LLTRPSVLVVKDCIRSDVVCISGSPFGSFLGLDATLNRLVRPISRVRFLWANEILVTGPSPMQEAQSGRRSPRRTRNIAVLTVDLLAARRLNGLPARLEAPSRLVKNAHSGLLRLFRSSAVDGYRGAPPGRAAPRRQATVDLSDDHPDTSMPALRACWAAAGARERIHRQLNRSGSASCPCSAPSHGK
jgi:hypothetical protein